MTKYPKKLLVIITEAALERQLVRDVRKLGAHGYTVHDVRGGGSTGEREGAWEADRTIEMKVVCDEDVADAIAEHVLRTHGPHYGLTLFFADVSVLRVEKY
ncbi:MAG: transcriptional regulator [Pseudomonadota bacterium]|nr:transcriptional regulator [Pseudomonadota bacterium]